MITTLTYLFAFIFVLSLVVIVHEGGHFAVARWCGVHVVEFSMGFGKELFGWTDKKGTRWKVCALPLGGYVKMLGDEDAASAKSSENAVPEEMRHLTFMAQKLWKRALIIFAGPATNYLFAVLVLTAVFWGIGRTVIPAVVGEVEENSVAAEAGLRAGDVFLDINGTPMREFSDVQRAIRLTEFGKKLVIRFERDGEVKETTALPRYDSERKMQRLGVRASTDVIVIDQDLTLAQSAKESVIEVATMTRDTLIYLGQVITAKRSADDMRGPLGIAEASGDAFKDGWLTLVVFIAQISVAVGFMNLLPIPVLDGGHLAFYAIEAVVRKPLPEKAQNVFLWMGVSLLFVLLAYTFLLDIPRILQRVLE